MRSLPWRNASPLSLPDSERDDWLIIRSDKSFIQGVAIPMSGSPEEREAKFSGKHSPVLIFIVDEGDAVPEEVYKGIEGCMSGGELVKTPGHVQPKSSGWADLSKREE